MAGPVQSPSSYLDFTGLGRLRGQARADSAAASREIGQQFEAMFIQMMLKSMREASPKSDFLQSQSMDTYQELHDKELSIHLARRGMLGIGNMLARNMEQTQPAPASADNLTKPAGLDGGPQGFPLARPKTAQPLHKPDRALTLERPHTGGFSLIRAEGAAAAHSGASAD
jgi:flagellar protein FlgJ